MPPDDQSIAQYKRADLTLRWRVARDLTSRFVKWNLLTRKNYYPTQLNPEDGIPDDHFNAPGAVNWVMY